MWCLVHGAFRGGRPRDIARCGTIVAVVSFLTLIDLFGSQALLPRLVAVHGVSPVTMGLAVNASTFGMAISGPVVGWRADRIDRKRGIWLCLALLSVPTFCLGRVDGVWAVLALRVVLGVFMTAAFSPTLTHLSEQSDVTAANAAMAPQVAGNVAANHFGRIMAVSAADAFGLSGSFFAFAALNLVGAVIALSLIGSQDAARPERRGSPLAAWRRHLFRPDLRAAVAMGLAILFVFGGVFTHVAFPRPDRSGCRRRCWGWPVWSSCRRSSRRPMRRGRSAGSGRSSTTGAISGCWRRSWPSPMRRM